VHQIGPVSTYDAAGNRTAKTNYLNGITSNYGYDLLYELTQVTPGGKHNGELHLRCGRE